MIELAFFLSLSVPDIAPAAHPQGLPTSSRLTAPLRCDDGSGLYQPDGSPNWECELLACSPHELTCWSERLDHCYDEAGDDNGVCSARKVTTCNSRWSCFKLWANCRGGEYGCNKPAWPGCGEGACTTASLKGSPPKKSASSSGAPHRATSPVRIEPRARRLLRKRTKGSVGGHDV